MRLREFITEKDLVQPTAQSQRAQGLIGPLGSVLKTLGGQPAAYVKGWKKWQQAKKRKDPKEIKKQEKKLRQRAAKMNPEQQAVAKKAVSDPTTTPTIRLVKGQRAQGGDGQEYVFGGGGQWINTSTGDDAKRDVAHTLFKQFLP
jgi:hypothetical protein